MAKSGRELSALFSLLVRWAALALKCVEGLASPGAGVARAAGHGRLHPVCWC